MEPSFPILRQSGPILNHFCAISDHSSFTSVQFFTISYHFFPFQDNLGPNFPILRHSGPILNHFCAISDHFRVNSVHFLPFWTIFLPLFPFQINLEPIFPILRHSGPIFACFFATSDHFSPHFFPFQDNLEPSFPISRRSGPIFVPFPAISDHSGATFLHFPALFPLPISLSPPPPILRPLLTFLALWKTLRRCSSQAERLMAAAQAGRGQRSGGDEVTPRDSEELH